MRRRLFYGWIIIAVTFVTMAIGVNARTSFSLFFPPIIDEFGWERGITAGAFSFGFLVSGAVSPLIGRTMDRFGPRTVMELGVALMAAGLFVLRRRPDYRPEYRTWGYPVVPIVFVVASLAIVINQFVSAPVDASLGLGFVALGVPVYHWLNADRRFS